VKKILILIIIIIAVMYFSYERPTQLPSIKSIAQTEVVTTTYKGHDISSFIVPNANDVTIHLSEPVNMDSMFCMPSGEWTTVREVLVEIGKTLAQKRTGIRRAGCFDCHSDKNGGTGFLNRAAGGGPFWETYNEFYERWSGNPTYIEADKKPFKNWSFLNSWRLHRDGIILTEGKRSDHPLEFQIEVALMEAHFSNDFILDCQANPFINEVSVAIFGRPFDLAIGKMMIAAYEFTLTTWDNRMNLIARYPDKYDVVGMEGFELFLKHGCNDCHANNLMADVRVKESVNGIKKAKSPGLDNNIIQHKGYFHTSEPIELWEAVAICGDVTEDEAVLMAEFIEHNLTSPSYY